MILSLGSRRSLGERRELDRSLAASSCAILRPPHRRFPVLLPRSMLQRNSRQRTAEGAGKTACWARAVPLLGSLLVVMSLCPTAQLQQRNVEGTGNVGFRAGTMPLRGPELVLAAGTCWHGCECRPFGRDAGRVSPAALGSGPLGLPSGGGCCDRAVGFECVWAVSRSQRDVDRSGLGGVSKACFECCGCRRDAAGCREKRAKRRLLGRLIVASRIVLRCFVLQVVRLTATRRLARALVVCGRAQPPCS